MRMRIFTSYRIGLLAAGAALAAVGAMPAQAQHNQVVLEQSVAPFGEGVKVLGASNPQAPVHFQVALKLRNYAALAASNAAGKVMTPAQLQRDHLPTKADYDKVLNWLIHSGLNVDKTSPSRMTIQVSGNVALVSRVLGVHFSHIQSEGAEYDAADTAPSLPRTIAAPVNSINGLQPHLHAYRQHIVTPMAGTASATAAPYYAQAFVTGYSATGLGAAGKGATTAIVIDTFPLASDLELYWKTVGSKQKIANFTFFQTSPGALPKLSGEESMDAQVSSTIAPVSKVRVYASQSLAFSNLDTAFQAIVDDINGGVKITEVSISLGACESKVKSGQITTDDNFFAVISGLGASVFVSTGDSGSQECGKKSGNTTSFYATSPNVTAAGGTSLTLKSDGSESAETAWGGSGGGLSSVFASPSYQSGLGFSKRAIPDISADANPSTGALVIINGRNNQIGGTSLSAPILAGLTALANADRIKHKKPTLGLLNSRIYSIPSSNFRDIVSGSNGGYSAGAGYDLVTGLGAPVMSNLIPTLTSQP